MCKEKIGEIMVFFSSKLKNKFLKKLIYEHAKIGVCMTKSAYSVEKDSESLTKLKELKYQACDITALNRSSLTTSGYWFGSKWQL